MHGPYASSRSAYLFLLYCLRLSLRLSFLLIPRDHWDVPIPPSPLSSLPRLPHSPTLPTISSPAYVLARESVSVPQVPLHHLSSLPAFFFALCDVPVLLPSLPFLLSFYHQTLISPSPRALILPSILTHFQFHPNKGGAEGLLVAETGVFLYVRGGLRRRVGGGERG
jgi:hypothetical protein